jgi:vitamin B12 transporter
MAGGSIILVSMLQSGARADEALPDVDVTATRVVEPVAKSASAITVIPAEEVQARGATGLTEVLRGAAPGLDIYQSGGVGTVTSVSLRGASSAQTLVLIDGIRVGDPSSTNGATDLGGFTANNIERIEVLRGPQSALYGSDAMGGVINIITKPGEGAPHGSAYVEGGSYGTVHSRIEESGSTGDWSYSFSIDGLHTDAFPRYGYRIRAPFSYLHYAYGIAPDVIDPTNKLGGSTQIRYRVNEEVFITGGFTGFDTGAHFDNYYSGTTAADTFGGFNRFLTTFAQGFLRIDDDAFGRQLHNRLTLYGNEIHRDYWETVDSCSVAYGAGANCKTTYQGARFGAEYQGDLKLGAYGLLTFGAKTETETLRNTAQDDPTAPQVVTQSARQTTNSAFVQHQFTVLDRLDISYGGRIDSIADGQVFETWRATLAYRLEETGTKLRASGGTGARAPSLFERFSSYGDPNLKAERSVGYDVGVDQKILGDRATLSASYFDNDYRNLIQGDPLATNCAAGYWCDYNVGRARMRSGEFAAEAWVIPDEFRLRGNYTYLDARNLVTGAPVALRPHNRGSLSAIYTGVANLELEARATIVGANPGNSGNTVILPAYAKYDLFAKYKLGHGFSVFSRLENLTDIRYQEAPYYSVAGRAVYGGVKYDW